VRSVLFSVYRSGRERYHASTGRVYRKESTVPHDEPASTYRPDPARVVEATIKGTPITVEFIQHAIDRMNERSISEEDVIAVLDTPDATGLPADEGRQRDRKNCGPSSALNVVYERLPDRLRIFSVYKSSRRISGRF
jgi:hypothetical protein